MIAESLQALELDEVDEELEIVKASKGLEKEALDRIKFLLHYRRDLIARASGQAIKACKEGKEEPKLMTRFFVCKNVDAKNNN